MIRPGKLKGRRLGQLPEGLPVEATVHYHWLSKQWYYPSMISMMMLERWAASLTRARAALEAFSVLNVRFLGHPVQVHINVGVYLRLIAKMPNKRCKPYEGLFYVIRFSPPWLGYVHHARRDRQQDKRGNFTPFTQLLYTPEDCPVVFLYL